jgi:tRNA nucleotidyltransferase/poly(A) polymerase
MNKILNFSRFSSRLGLNYNDIKTIESSLKKKRGKLFLVGGSVRDLILKEKLNTNPDLVCDLPIHLIVQCLKDQKIKVLDVGIKFGSVVAITNDNSIDITSMRKDIKSNGRHPEIEYTKNIFEDAARRDFTVNSIYCDLRGNLFDPNGGIKDLKKSKIVFIGKPMERIEEDFLRILRFLRFTLTYSNKFDSDGFKACLKFQKKLKNLSFERRLNELSKILVTRNCEKQSSLKKIKSVLQFAIESNVSINNYERLCKIERELKLVSFERRLKFLTRKSKTKLNFLTKINKFFRKRLVSKFDISKYSKYKIFKMLKSSEKFLIYDNVLIKFADKQISRKRLLQEIRNVEKLEGKAFPIKGSDLMKFGFWEGKKVGLMLDKIEKWWVENDLEPDKKHCLLYAKELPSGKRRK